LTNESDKKALACRKGRSRNAGVTKETDQALAGPSCLIGSIDYLHSATPEPRTAKRAALDDAIDSKLIDENERDGALFTATFRCLSARAHSGHPPVVADGSDVND
jgi:hypothetical protein